MGNLATRSGEGGARQNEGTECGTTGQHRFAGRSRHHVAVHVVRVVLVGTVVVCSVHGNGLTRNVAQMAVDMVRGLEPFTVGEALHVAIGRLARRDRL